jgi:hypothetical protein
MLGRMEARSRGRRAVNPPEKDPLLFIAQVDYRGHTIKIARRGKDIRLLIHRPQRMFAVRMITDLLANYESALQEARRTIDQIVDSEA